MIIMGDRHNQMDWAVFGIPLGVIIFFIGCIYGSVCSRMVVQTRIDDHFVWLKGVHPDFLAELPEWPYHP
jgi:di/tricarboxylate transporter